jgi:hypothetical protein
MNSLLTPWRIGTLYIGVRWETSHLPQGEWQGCLSKITTAINKSKSYLIKLTLLKNDPIFLLYHYCFTSGGRVTTTHPPITCYWSLHYPLCSLLLSEESGVSVEKSSVDCVRLTLRDNLGRPSQVKSNGANHFSTNVRINRT